MLSSKTPCWSCGAPPGRHYPACTVESHLPTIDVHADLHPPTVTVPYREDHTAKPAPVGCHGCHFLAEQERLLRARVDDLEHELAFLRGHVEDQDRLLADLRRRLDEARVREEVQNVE